MPDRRKLIEGPINHLGLCRYGMMMYNIHDAYVGRSLDLYGEFSELEVSLFRQLIRPGDTVVDVGANIGAHTLFFALAVGKRGRVLAFEPQRFVFQTLCGNLALNSMTHVECHQLALGQQSGSLLIPPIDYSRQNNFGGLEVDHWDHGEPIEVRTLDSFALAQCRLLKIDVEGMEGRVLEGARDTIARVRPIMYVENDRQEKAAILMQLIDSLGYTMYKHYPTLYNPDNFYKNPDNVFGKVASTNLACVPRETPIAMQGYERVQVA